MAEESEQFVGSSRASDPRTSTLFRVIARTKGLSGVCATQKKDEIVLHLEQKELAERWRMSPRTLEQWRWQGGDRGFSSSAGASSTL